MSSPSNTHGPLWPFYSALRVGRVVHDGKRKGTIQFPAFHDPEQCMDLVYVIKWNDSDMLESVSASTVETKFLQAEFAQDDKLVPRQIQELQKHNWNSSAVTINPVSKGSRAVKDAKKDKDKEHAQHRQKADNASARKSEQARQGTKEDTRKEAYATPKHISREETADSSEALQQSRLKRQRMEEVTSVYADESKWVRGWNKCYPRELCLRPGDKLAADLTDEEMEGDFVVEKIMDEIMWEGERWFLLKWKGYELRPGPGVEALSRDDGTKGDWELADSVPPKGKLMAEWTHSRPEWWTDQEEGSKRKLEAAIKQLAKKQQQGQGGGGGH